MGRSPLAVVAVIAAICPACLGGSASPPARPDAGHVVGLVALSEAGGPPGSAGTFDLRITPIPHARLVVTRRTPGARLTRRLRADVGGGFRLSVPPGCYTIVAQIRPTAGPGAEVCVRAGETARVAVTESRVRA
jgi:hypothetical protein